MSINIIETFDRRETEKHMEHIMKKLIYETTSKEFKTIIKLLKELIILIENKRY